MRIKTYEYAIKMPPKRKKWIYGHNIAHFPLLIVIYYRIRLLTAEASIIAYIGNVLAIVKKTFRYILLV